MFTKAKLSIIFLVSVLVGCSTAGKTLTSTDSGLISINFVNNRKTDTVYVSFTVDNIAQSPGPIALGSGCTSESGSANATSFSIAPGTTCSATVDPTSSVLTAVAGSSRFCASKNNAPTNCMLAQENNQTVIEPTFNIGVPIISPNTYQPSGPCYGSTAQGNCVTYDISVIPSNCTDELWYGVQPPPIPAQSSWGLCEGAGGASYNLPVQLSCAGSNTYTCQGPVDNTWGNNNYPSNCGNPAATFATCNNPFCSPGQGNGVSAYFFPMYSPPQSAYQPNSLCANGNPLNVTFMDGD
jgi:hypothetical protein